MERYLQTSEAMDLNNIKQVIEIGKLVPGAGTGADEMAERAQKLRDSAAPREKTAVTRMLSGAAGILFVIVLALVLVARSVTKPLHPLGVLVVSVEQRSDLNFGLGVDREQRAWLAGKGSEQHVGEISAHCE